MATEVSIVMPAYERPMMMAEAIESALKQTVTDFELLIGDNSKSDDVADLVASFDDDRITYIRNKPATDAQNNWVDLVRACTTPYFASLHDDDIWEPEFLERTLEVMRSAPDLGMVFCDYSIIDGQSNLLDSFSNKVTAWHNRDNIPEGRFYYDLEKGIRLTTVWNSPQPAYAALLNTKLVQQTQFTDRMSPLYDIWLSYQMVVNQVGLYYIPDRLTRYRVHEKSLTSSSFAAAEDTFYSFVIEQHSDLGVVKEVEEHWADLRWARATKAMIDRSADKKVSQEQFAQAYGGLHGSKKVAAWLGAHSDLVWNGIRWMKTNKAA